MSSSFQSINSENSTSGQTSTHLNISSTAELWEYFELICQTKYNFSIKAIHDYPFLNENICLLAIIRRACILSGITLKLFQNKTNEKGDNNINIRLNNNFRLSVENIQSINTKLKNMKAEPKDLKVAMQEAQDCVHLSCDPNRKMQGIKIMLNLIEEARQIFGTYNERYIEFLNMLGKMYCSSQLAMYAEAILIYRQAIDI